MCVLNLQRTNATITLSAASVLINGSKNLLIWHLSSLSRGALILLFYNEKNDVPEKENRKGQKCNVFKIICLLPIQSGLAKIKAGFSETRRERGGAATRVAKFERNLSTTRSVSKIYRVITEITLSNFEGVIPSELLVYFWQLARQIYKQTIWGRVIDVGTSFLQ